MYVMYMSSQSISISTHTLCNVYVAERVAVHIPSSRERPAKQRMNLLANPLNITTF